MPCRIIDPLSIIPGQKTKARVLSFTYNAEKSSDKNIAPLDYKQFSFDLATGVKGRELVGTKPGQDECLNRLGDILETHTIVHDVAQEPDGVKSGNEYYLTKSGSPIRVTVNGNNVQAQGGMQIENQKTYPGLSGTVPGFYYASTEQTYEKTNGTTYCVNAPIQPAVQSVYKVMSEMGNNKFLELCTGVTEDILTKTGTVVYDPEASDDEKRRELNKYLIFINNKGLDQNVSFFTNFNYTVYIPTDAAVEKEIAEKKLPTWDSIREYITQHEVDGVLPEGAKEIAKAQVACLLNFVRGHFQDNSEFADKNATSVHNYNSATLDDAGQKFVTITSQQTGNGEMVLKKDGYYDCKVTSKKNIIARDYITNVDYSAANINLIGSQIKSSAYSVIHEVDGVLRYTKLNEGETYESKYWSTAAKAKRTAANFRIKNK